MPTELVDILVDLAHDLTEADLKQVVRVLKTIEGPGDTNAVKRLYQAIPHDEYRHKITALTVSWQTTSVDLTGAALALALQTSTATDAARREDISVELAWTGPGTPSIPLRRTDRVLLDLIDAAQEELWIVSFVVTKVPDIGQALKNAVARGVSFNLIVETEGAGAAILNEKQLRALSKDFNNQIRTYYWPVEQRKINEKGQYGSLHVKCAIADRRQMFVSSANLTEFALSLNMELGVVLQGKLLPERVVRHFETLVQKGILVEGVDNKIP